MDDIALGYLIHRFFYRFFNFFHHWYVDGSRGIARRFVSTLEQLDRSFAVAITFRYFFQPLYKDYTVIGRILGVIFRTVRIIIGVLIYFVIGLFFLAFYLAWILLPALLIWYAGRELVIRA
jgi:hypothetical protein